MRFCYILKSETFRAAYNIYFNLLFIDILSASLVWIRAKSLSKIDVDSYIHKKFFVALVFCAQMSNPLWNLGLSYKSMQAKMLGWVTFKKLLRYPFKYSATQICILCIASLFFVKNKFLISPIYCNVSTKSECCLISSMPR